ncbi:MAG: pyridoxamine 5'-phosphate oxidase family protein [Polyangiaceae bacterium]|nr:pyridoxamine 5'-phosphate oxidase family protein [Polyangiaceae bacterium]
MAKLPAAILEAWTDREGPVVLTTVSPSGVPNSIYATCVATYEDEGVLVANNYFKKTLENLAGGGKATLLFLRKSGKSYQIKGSIEYFTQGPVFDHMKTWNPPQHPGRGVARLRAEQIYSGAEQLL